MRRLVTIDAIVGWAERCLWVAGVLALGYCAYVLLDARIYQARESRWLDQVLHSQQKLSARRDASSAPAAAPNQIEPQPEAHRLIGRLEIPRLGFSAMVLDGSDERTLQLGVGHLHGTALPGASGNVVLAAHRDTFFRPLRNIQDGDRITLITTHGAYKYHVESTAVVDPQDTQVLGASARPTLTLVTCYPFSYVGAAPKRFIVEAREGSGPGPSAAPHAVRPLYTARDPGAQPRQMPPIAASTKLDDPGPDNSPDKSTLDTDDTPAGAAESVDHESSPQPRRKHRRLPGRLFGKLAGIVRRAT